MDMKLSEMTIDELVAAEKAAISIRKLYEDKLAIFRASAYYPTEGTKDFNEYQELSKKLALSNSTRLKIISEMEKRLAEIETDD